VTIRPAKALADPNGRDRHRREAGSPVVAGPLARVAATHFEAIPQQDDNARRTPQALSGERTS
jgi:hypothetical protein